MLYFSIKTNLTYYDYILLEKISKELSLALRLFNNPKVLLLMTQNFTPKCGSLAYGKSLMETSYFVPYKDESAP